MRVEPIEGPKRPRRRADLAVRATPSFVRRIERRNRVLTLRRRGMTYEQIAQVITDGRDGFDPEPTTGKAVANLVRGYLQGVNDEVAENVAELRALENERLDELLAAWGPAARAGDQRAANVVLRIMERRAKMNGLDAAQRVEHSVNGSILHELGTDPEEVAREREAFATAFALPEGDVDDVIDGVVADADA